jgi:hypothetical protein
MFWHLAPNQLLKPQDASSESWIEGIKLRGLQNVGC